jgi:hypothetical protein
MRDERLKSKLLILSKYQRNSTPNADAMLLSSGISMMQSQATKCLISHPESPAVNNTPLPS